MPNSDLQAAHGPVSEQMSRKCCLSGPALLVHYTVQQEAGHWSGCLNLISVQHQWCKLPPQLKTGCWA